MTAHSTIQRSETGTPVKLVPAHVLLERLNEIHSLIASRAYELFERRGRVDGEDVSDWLQAEDELVHSCRHDVKESAEAFSLHAEMPGLFTADQLQVSVEPHRLIVSGEKQVIATHTDGKTTWTEPDPRRIFRVHTLPAKVDPLKSTAVLKGDTLEVHMPKVTAVNKTKDKADAASLGR